MTTRATILAKALEGYDGPRRADLSYRCGVPIGLINRAAGQRPVSADHFIRLCAVIGIDPSTGDTVAPLPSAGEFDHGQLAMAIRMHMDMRKHSIRAAAATVNLSATVFLRLRDGKATAIESVCAGCRYVGLHPFGYLKPAHDVSRETISGTAPIGHKSEVAA